MRKLPSACFPAPAVLPGGKAAGETETALHFIIRVARNACLLQSMAITGKAQFRRTVSRIANDYGDFPVTKLQKIVHKLYRRRLVIDGDAIGRQHADIARHAGKRHGRGGQFAQDFGIVRHGRRYDNAIETGGMGRFNQGAANIIAVFNREDQQTISRIAQAVERPICSSVT